MKLKKIPVPSPEDSPRPKSIDRPRITITCRAGGSVTLPPPAGAPSTLDSLITESETAPSMALGPRFDPITDTTETDNVADQT